MRASLFEKRYDTKFSKVKFHSILMTILGCFSDGQHNPSPKRMLYCCLSKPNCQLLPQLWLTLEIGHCWGSLVGHQISPFSWHQNAWNCGKHRLFYQVWLTLWPPLSPADTKHLFVLVMCGLKTFFCSESVPSFQQGCKTSQGSLPSHCTGSKDIIRCSILNQKAR